MRPNVSCSICLGAIPQCITRTFERAKKINCQALSSNWTWILLFSRLTCNTGPRSFQFTLILSCQGCVCPHNPIIPDKIFHYLEYSFGFAVPAGHALFPAAAAAAIWAVQLWQQYLFVLWNITPRWVFPIGPNGWSFSEVMACCCQWGVIAVTVMSPSLDIAETLSRVTEGSSHEMLPGNGYDWLTLISLHHEYPRWCVQLHENTVTRLQSKTEYHEVLF